MSVANVCKTDFTDEGTLVGALKEILGETKVVIVPGGVDVRGFSSGVRPTIIIKTAGLYGTAGYAKVGGKWELIYDSTDSRKLTKLLPKKKGDVTHNYLAQVYSRLRVVEGMKAIKGSLVKNQIEEDGSIRLRVRTVSYGE